MAYTIKQFNPYTGQLIVEFDPTYGTFTIDVPITQEGLYITGEVLDLAIKGFEPKDFIERKRKIASGVANSNEIAALAETVYVEPSSADVEAAQAAIESAKAAEIEKYVKAALIKLGVISV